MARAWPVRDLDPAASLETNARRILATRIAEFYSYTPIVRDTTAVEPLHNLRIAAKRLRYTLELFRAVFGKTGERQIERVKAIQEALGQLHDHDVRIVLIEGELRRVAAEQAATLGQTIAAAPLDRHAGLVATALRPPPDDPRRGLLALLSRQHASRRDTHTTFVTLWDEVNRDGMRRDLVMLSVSPLS